jgi:hypothetical protein
VGTLNRSAASVKRRAEYFLNAQQRGSRHRPYDINDRIHRADFVKVNSIDRCLMDLGLSLRQSRENSDTLLLNRICEIALSDDGFDIRQMPMMTLIGFIYDNVCLTAAEAFFQDFFDLEIIMIQLKFGQCFFQFLKR